MYNMNDLMSEHEIFKDGLQEINMGIGHLTSENNELNSLKQLKSGFGKIDQIWLPSTDL